MSTIPLGHEKYSVEGTSLVLSSAHHPIIRDYCHASNGVLWRCDLTLAEYVRREHVVGDSEMIKKGNTFWVFYDTEIPLGLNSNLDSDVLEIIKDTALNMAPTPSDATSLKAAENAKAQCSQIIGSCESCLRPGFRTIIKPDGVVELVKVPTHVIGNVYILPEYRKKGLGISMLKALTDCLDYHKMEEYEDANPGISKYGFQTLYSGVGQFYAQFGFVSDESKLTEIKTPTTAETIKLDSSIKLLPRHAFNEYANLDIEYLQSMMLKKSQKDNIPRVAILPTAETFDFFHSRSEYYSTILTVDHQKTTYHGAEIIHDNKRDKTFIIWFHDFIKRKLFIIRLFSNITNIEDSKQYIYKLIYAALSEAQKFNLESTLIWRGDLPYGGDESYAPILQEEFGKFGFETGVTNKSLSALREWKSGQDGRQFPIWEYNGKYCYM